MRVSLNWLKEYVEITMPPEELAERLTMAGIAVAGITKRNEGIEKVVTGRIRELKKHPAADKLAVCQVDIGGSSIQIVTGAANVAEGDVVPVALAGARLPGGKTIETSTLRGVPSRGMLCSAAELGFEGKVLAPEQRDGIYILPANTPVGQDAVQVLGLDDVVLEFEITPNRPDCLSVVGIAREIAALTERPLTMPLLSLAERGENAAKLTSVAIEAPDLCPRFIARVIRNVKIGPSPFWLQQRLQAAGVRPINNIVDITNYVMLELGQPMHAYDYNLLARHSIVVRTARPGEKLTTLDGVKRELTPEMLVIADALQPVGIAGVMGGLATEVTANTKNILLEAASFNPTSIRRTSRQLNLRTEASYRFERGVDINGVLRAIDRAAKLIEDMGIGEVCQGVVDQYVQVVIPPQITMRPERVNRHLGTALSGKEMAAILSRLEFGVEGRDPLRVTVPSWRMDVTREADLAEEVARIYGYNRIPATLPGELTGAGGQEDRETDLERARDVLAAAGLREVITFSFSHPRRFEDLRLAEDDPLRRAIPLLNPITDEFPLMRTTLMPGVLEVLARNLARQSEDVGVFEIGAVYRPRALPLSELPEEKTMLVVAMMGRRFAPAWSQPRDTVDFYDVKGVLEELLERLRIHDYRFRPGQHPSFHPGKTANLVLGDDWIGIAGEIHPLVQEAFGINRKVYLAELDLTAVLDRVQRVPDYRPLPRFPAVVRDLAVIIPENVLAAQVMDAVRNAGGVLLQDVRLFDVYTGAPVPEGSRSLAFTLTYQAADRTLTDSEVDAVQEEILTALSRQFGATLRG